MPEDLSDVIKKAALEFLEFRENYRREQLKTIKDYQKKKGGIITWDYTPDDKIYDKYIQSKNDVG